MTLPHSLARGARALLAAAVFLALPTLRGSAFASTATADPELVSGIEALVRAPVDTGKVPGISVAVLKDGEVLLARGFGLAELENEVPADERTVYRIASVTKQFTAACILRLVEDGLLELDDLAAKHVPEFDFQGREVTIRHLLTHTSGIPSYTDLDEAWTSRLHEDLTEMQILEMTEGMPYHFEPGARFEYDNTGYVMLGSIVESVTGSPWHEFLVQDVLAPLDLPSIRYGDEDVVIKRRAQGYERGPGGFRHDIRFSMTHPAAAGALVSNIVDLARWSRALATGRVVSAQAYDAMTTPYVTNDGTDTGYGFGIGRADIDDVQASGHGGGIFGFGSYLLAVPDHDLHVALIANAGGVDHGAIAREIARLVLDLPAPEVLDLPVAVADLARCPGRYEGMMKATVTAEGGQLFVQPEGQGRFGLRHQGDLRFRASFDPEVEIRFDVQGEQVTGFFLKQAGMDLRFRRVE